MIEGLKLDRMRGHIGHIEPGEHLFGRLGIVISRPADQGKAGQGDHGIDTSQAIFHKEFVNRRPGIQTGRKGRYHPQSTRLQRCNHTVVMASIARQQIGAQHQNTDRSDSFRGCRSWQSVGLCSEAPGHAWVINTELRVFHRGGHFAQAPQDFARPVSTAINGMAHQVEHVVIGAAQPVLKRHEIGPHILCCTWDEAQHLRQTAQHFHLRSAPGCSLVFAATTQFFEQSHRAAGGLVHVEITQPGQLDHLGRRGHANHGITAQSAAAQVIQNWQEMVLQKQHAGDHDVGLGNVGPAAGNGSLVAGVFGGGMQVYCQAWQLLGQNPSGPVNRARQVGVHGHNNQPKRDRCRVIFHASVQNAPWLHTGFRP